MTMRSVSHALVLALVLMGTGCMFQGMTPQARFKEEVQGMNDESRWNRVDLAQQRVAPSYQAQFATARSGWGKKVQLADLDVVSMQMGEGGAAVSIVAMSWYNMEDMTLRSSVVRQQWTSNTTRYSLVSESVIDGDAEIFSVGSAARAKALLPKAAPATDAPAKTAENDSSSIGG